MAEELQYMKGLGWSPQLPDFRDFPFASVARSTSSLPISSSIRENCSPVRDQGSIGSCVGFAVSGAVEYLRRTDADDFSTIYSPLHTYYKAREMRGWQGEDTGCYLRDAVKVIQKVGATPESAWPYREDKFTRKPNATADKKALRWRLGVYRACQSLNEILLALADKMPVVGGFTCFASMFSNEVAATGNIMFPTSYYDWSVGGHAVLFTGFDRTTSRLEFKNSWSDSWGNGGYGTLPFEYVNRGLAGDFWALTMESEESVRASVIHNNLIKV